MPEKLKIIAVVKDQAGHPVEDADVSLLDDNNKEVAKLQKSSETRGLYACDQPGPGDYELRARARFPTDVCLSLTSRTLPVSVPRGSEEDLLFEVGLIFVVVDITPSTVIPEGGVVKLRAIAASITRPINYEWTVYQDEECGVELDSARIYGKTSEECILDPNLPPERPSSKTGRGQRDPSRFGAPPSGESDRPDRDDSQPEVYRPDGTEKDLWIQVIVREEGTEELFATGTIKVAILLAGALTERQEKKYLYDRAKDLALLFKDNFDKKLDSLAGGVSAVAGQLPGTGAALRVQLQRAPRPEADARPFWVAVRNRTEAITVNRLTDFIERIFCANRRGDPVSSDLRDDLDEIDDKFRQPSSTTPGRQGSAFQGIDSYGLLRTAVQAFLIQECGIVGDAVPHAARNARSGRVPNDDNMQIPGETERADSPLTYGVARKRLQAFLPNNTLPYIQRIVNYLFPRRFDRQEVPPLCYGILRGRSTSPCMIELIWSYFHEEGMLVQSMNAISRRFQNIRGSGDKDPLAGLTIDPLRPLSNLLWGYIQTEKDRLSLLRRSYEFDSEYGLRLVGRAVPAMRSADSRTKFLQAFHDLLYECTRFYQQEDDTTVIADGFPVLNALKEVHLILSQGAHNQYNDLVWTARAEMLLEQWLLGRSEFREFLPSRPMVAYPENWMHRVDSMKQLQGWTDVSVIHFNNLARWGEQVLLTIRFDDWNAATRVPNDAASWARYWRAEIQGYIHAYRTVTGVDLTAEKTDTRPGDERYQLPSVHLERRLAGQR